METEKKPAIGRIVALFEVLLCSDFPTQLAVGATLNVIGMRPMTAGVLSLRYLVYLSLIDTVLLLGLIFFFLRSHRERVRDVLLGSRSWLREAELGVPFVAGAFLVAVAVISLVRLLVPSLHNLERNPLQDVIHGRVQAALFAVVVVVADGLIGLVVVVDEPAWPACGSVTVTDPTMSGWSAQ